MKDREISYSSWKKTESAEYPPTFQRDISFIHPLNNAVGPSEAKTTRQQQYQQYGQYGICVRNATRVHGVPGADCFRLEDRWIVERTSESSVTLTVTFQLVFHKRTMFKPIIQKNSRAETKKWFAGFSNYLQNALEDDTKKSTNSMSATLSISDIGVEPICDTEIPALTGISLSWSYIFGLAFAFVAMGLQIVWLHGSIYSMQEQLTEIQNHSYEMERLLKEFISMERTLEISEVDS